VQLKEVIQYFQVLQQQVEEQEIQLLQVLLMEVLVVEVEEIFQEYKVLVTRLL
jgi:hypothetical protein|tara:strand:+ start:154 stop:312 length:159 start_codon:yes stop_codon:yes gene_type:complete